VIQQITTRDVRFNLPPGDGSDAIHANPQYSYAVTRIEATEGISGTGLAFTLGRGNNLVCEAIEMLREPLLGRDIEGLMADFRRVFHMLAEEPQLRWLGPHKGVVHLALASITNACFDLWAKRRGVPMWRLLLDLTPEQIVALLDLSYLEDVLTETEALAMLRQHQLTRCEREGILKRGYEGYDTSIGWFRYSDEQVAENVRRALDAGFQAFKLKIGSPDPAMDVRRVGSLRKIVGNNARLMVDVNQQWALPKAIRAGRMLIPYSPYWIEEPTHPDDIHAHQVLAQEIAPIGIALGEHVPNRIVFKNYLQAGCVRFLQPDCVRVGGVSEFLTVSLMARKFGVPVVPHVGDMGQIHQHLVLFNHIALDLPEIFLEYIPHLRRYFRYPAEVSGGFYRVPQDAGSSSDLV
jgi:L-fuconate dehydratase